jgi:pimeloyl-ACP methyl ester carboxylesterase
MKNIIFIHGMFQNPKSWDKWSAYFTEKGYNCIAPAWPYHEGEPAQLRANPSPQLGDLSLQEIVDEFTDIACGVESPILIGHSVGGLVVQLLINKGIGAAGVCINSVAPNAMLALDWGFMKNSALIANPFKGNQHFEMDLEGFQGSFCNTMSPDETKVAYETYATHDSRNVLRDCMGEAGTIDLDLPHVPLLFIAGEKDQIIPPELNEKNSEAYTDEASLTYFEQFTNRGHFICGEPGWEEVAQSVYDWLEEQTEAITTDNYAGHE